MCPQVQDTGTSARSPVGKQSLCGRCEVARGQLGRAGLDADAKVEARRRTGTRDRGGDGGSVTSQGASGIEGHHGGRERQESLPRAPCGAPSWCDQFPRWRQPGRPPDPPGWRRPRWACGNKAAPQVRSLPPPRPGVTVRTASGSRGLPTGSRGCGGHGCPPPAPGHCCASPLTECDSLSRVTAPAV